MAEWRAYSIYLWHMEVVQHVWPMLRDALPQTAASKMVFADALFRIVGAVLFGRLMTALVEAPMLRLRERIVPARRAARLASGREPPAHPAEPTVESDRGPPVLLGDRRREGGADLRERVDVGGGG